VTFTGSTAAGSRVAEEAGRAIKKQVLELGGSDAYVVLEDADLDLAVDVCVNARLINSGQSCVSAKRFIVVKSLRKEFEQRMTEAMEAANYGDPMNKASRIGPLARMDLRDALHEQVMDSIANGAKLLCGGKIPEGAGSFYPPTVLTNVKKGMPAYDEELFGPVAAIIEAKDETDALKKANDSIYGLGAAIFSKDRKRAEWLAAHELNAGNCFVNGSVHSDPHLPFGGTKQSGYGRELGSFGIREFTNIKTVFVN
jgi:succinate-semialdehyde dehydrogenase/glutarate-semialdehyde dehydrogenase